MPRIAWIEDADAQGPLIEAFATARQMSPRGVVADIIWTMSLRPDFLTAIVSASRLHFSDRALARVQHEMLAYYVAALNHCHY